MSLDSKLNQESLKKWPSKVGKGIVAGIVPIVIAANASAGNFNCGDKFPETIAEDTPIQDREWKPDTARDDIGKNVPYRFLSLFLLQDIPYAEKFLEWANEASEDSRTSYRSASRSHFIPQKPLSAKEIIDKEMFNRPGHWAMMRIIDDAKGVGIDYNDIYKHTIDNVENEGTRRFAEALKIQPRRMGISDRISYGNEREENLSKSFGYFVTGGADEGWELMQPIVEGTHKEDSATVERVERWRRGESDRYLDRAEEKGGDVYRTAYFLENMPDNVYDTQAASLVRHALLAHHVFYSEKRGRREHAASYWVMPEYREDICDFVLHHGFSGPLMYAVFPRRGERNIDEFSEIDF